MADLSKGMKSALAGIVANAVLAVVKITTGVVGNSYALVADGIEVDKLTPIEALNLLEKLRKEVK